MFSFSNCQQLTKLIIPSSIKEISYCCFEQCYQLKEVELGGYIKMNPKSFWQCHSLKIKQKTFCQTLQSFFKYIGKTLQQLFN